MTIKIKIDIFLKDSIAKLVIIDYTMVAKTI